MSLNPIIKNNNSNLPSNNNNNNYIDNSKGTPNLSFATYNVNSLQCKFKNNSINDTFINFNTDFVGLKKTRYKSDQFYHYN